MEKKLYAMGLLFLTACAHQTTKSVVPPAGVPQLVQFRYRGGELTSRCRAAMDKLSADIDQVAKGTVKTPSALLQMERVMAEFGDATNVLQFMSYVSTDEKLRKEGDECQNKCAQLLNTITSRKDLYQQVKKSKTSGAAEKRLYAETVRSFELNGLHLPDAELQAVLKLKNELAALQTSFTANLNNDKSVVEYTKDELEGVPENYFEGWTQKEGRYIVPANMANISVITENAKKGIARKKFLVAWDSRAAAANMPLLTQAVKLRGEIARRLGFKNYADFATSNRMAKNSQAVATFLNGLKAKLAQASRRDLAKLQKLKAEWEPQDPQMHAWDVRFYDEQTKRRQHSVDAEKIREYFPADRVIQGVFEIYSQLWAIAIQEVKNAEFWSPEVKLFAVTDKKTGELIGHFYMDLFPREGKYGHAAAFSLLMGRQKDGAYQKILSAIVANFQPPRGGKPSLWTQDDVETFFHELGHIMHGMLTRAPYASLAGTSVYNDFVEAPSQMLENWAWEPKILEQISGHYLRPQEKLPASDLKALVASRYANKGLGYTRQLVLAIFDQRLHTLPADKVDPKAIYQKTYEELVGVESLKEGFFPATFNHIMGGYEAGYYGYLWSEVFAYDLYSRFKKEGYLSAKVGGDYRRHILAEGNMADPQALLERFLKRPANHQAFLKMIDSLGNN